MRILRCFRAVVVLASAALIATPCLVHAQGAKAKESQKGPHASQKAEGVVTRVEPIKPNAGNDKHQMRLTIKTSALWSDYVRDTSQVSPKAPTSKVAEQGNQGIAAKGQPSTAETKLVVDLVPETRLETRFRAASDETNAGSKTPAEAKAKTNDPQSKHRSKESPHSSDRPGKLSAGDLKPGLFVEVEYRHDDKTNQNPAAQVIVLRPIEGPQSPSSDEVKTRTSNDKDSK